MIAIIVLFIHFHFNCYCAFYEWQLTSKISDQLLKNISHTGLLNEFLKSKLVYLGLLLLSILGVKGRKSIKLHYPEAFAYLLAGSTLYFSGAIAFYVNGFDKQLIAIGYMVVTSLGFILVFKGGGMLTCIMKNKLKPDVFNKANETFPQEERLLQNEYSVNLPAHYQLKGKLRNSWINIINPMRGNTGDRFTRFR